LAVELNRDNYEVEVLEAKEEVPSKEEVPARETSKRMKPGEDRRKKGERKRGRRRVKKEG